MQPVKNKQTKNHAFTIKTVEINYWQLKTGVIITKSSVKFYTFTNQFQPMFMCQADVLYGVCFPTDFWQSAWEASSEIRKIEKKLWLVQDRPGSKRWRRWSPGGTLFHPDSLAFCYGNDCEIHITRSAKLLRKYICQKAVLDAHLKSMCFGLIFLFISFLSWNFF